VSTLQRRRELLDLIPRLPAREAAAASSQPNRVLQFVLGNATEIVATLALVWLASVALVVVNYFVQLNLVALIYMLPVVIAATQWGAVAGIIAAVAGAAAADFFFYPPIYTFWIGDPQSIGDLVLFLLVALVTSNLASRVRREADSLSRREREIKDLHAFSQGLATCLNSRDLIFAIQDYLSNTLRYRAVLIACAGGDDADAIAVPAAIRREAAKLMDAKVPRAAVALEPRSQKSWLIRAIAPEILGYGAIAVELGETIGESNETVARRVEALLDEAMLTVEHLKAKETLEQAAIDFRTEVLRDALIGGVSHELRTPLASILGSCSVLAEMPAVRGDRNSLELIEGVADQASRLDGEIRDLLDATRITAKGVTPQLQWTDPTDIVDAAVRQKARRLASHWVVLDLERDTPLVHVDTVLVEQALGQLLENAAKYSPIGSKITVTSRCEHEEVALSVTDQGSGLTAEEKEEIGKRSFRSRRHAGDVQGSGLGLWIASTFVGANGGTLHAQSLGPNLGSTITLRLPTVSEGTPAFADLPEALND
jgi:K+-sensing histidine kinase KdpD